MNEPKDSTQQCAEKIYDVYCEAVGGKAFNGDPLPGSAEFFTDKNKQKQANAWLYAAEESRNFWANKLHTGINVAIIAIACHSANKAICEANGDFSQKSWQEAETWQKESSVHGVNFVIHNPDVTPEMQHQAWCDSKIKDGWVYGPEKNPEKKEHHCLVPYDQLPPAQTIKDLAFTTICKALIPFLAESPSEIA